MYKIENKTSYILSMLTSNVKDFAANDTPNGSINRSSDLCSGKDTENNNSIVAQIGAQLLIAFLMLGLGCTTEFKLMWKYIKAPKQILTGLVLQLVFLPLWGFALSQIFMLSEAETMGAIIVASCPGGVYSNIASYWLDGDMDLSIVLTSLSTILAMGTLPLWLFVLPQIKHIENECLEIPFESLGYSIIGIIVPVILGLLIKWKFLKAANILTKMSSVLGSFFAIGTVVYLGINEGFYFISNIYWKTILFCLIFPLTAILCGYLATRVPWLTFSVAARRTIAIETAMQNSALAITIILVSYNISSSHFASVIIIPFLYSMIQLGSALIVVTTYLMAKFTGNFKWLNPQHKDDEDEEKMEHVLNKEIVVINNNL